jgi:hypothetical protein
VIEKDRKKKSFVFSNQENQVNPVQTIRTVTVFVVVAAIF